MPNKTPRIASIDLFRGFTVFLMLFVNDLWSVSNVPHWMGHASFHEDFLGLSDLVFPSFLFILGMSTPLAIQKRIQRNESYGKISKHIVVRSFSLIIMGVYLVNGTPNLTDYSYISESAYALLKITAFFLIWNNYPTKSRQTRYTLLKIIGWGILLFLYIIYEDSNGNSMQPKWWGILGLIGWTYLVCSFLYLFSYKRISLLLLYTTFFITMSVLGSLNLLGHCDDIIVSNGCFHAFTMFGVILTLFIQKNRTKNNMKIQTIMLLVAGALLILGWFSNRFWIISKLQETPPWLFYSTGITILVYSLFYYLIDVKGEGRWFSFLNPGGRYTLTCYLIPSIFYAIYSMFNFRFTGALAETPLGIIKSILFSLICILSTHLITKVHIRLKL